LVSRESRNEFRGARGGLQSSVAGCASADGYLRLLVCEPFLCLWVRVVRLGKCREAKIGNRWFPINAITSTFDHSTTVGHLFVF
jgi:hypothetical protein